jgi:hypothetical protein
MAKAKISKNAKTNRGSVPKPYVTYNDKEIEVCPAMFIGAFANAKTYMAVQEKATKKLLLDNLGNPLSWQTTIKNYKM